MKKTKIKSNPPIFISINKLVFWSLVFVNLITHSIKNELIWSLSPNMLENDAVQIFFS